MGLGTDFRLYVAPSTGAIRNSAERVWASERDWYRRFNVLNGLSRYL